MVLKSFNRTILELKSLRNDSEMMKRLAFNRTILELKYYYSKYLHCRIHSFNRTILELKSDDIADTRTDDTRF